MEAGNIKKDRHFPLFAHDNPLRRLFGSPQEFCVYVAENQIVADLGCGPGYHTLALAECVGRGGRVYAVDSDERAIQAVEKKAARRGLRNIEAHASSAADLSFIGDGAVDFVLANGLLCSMAPKDHESAVSEIKRVLKPSGKAYLSVAKGAMSYVDDAEWEDMLQGFRVERSRDGNFLQDRWALVSRKEE